MNLTELGCAIGIAVVVVVCAGIVYAALRVSSWCPRPEDWEE